jgi:hypothetical protein
VILERFDSKEFSQINFPSIEPKDIISKYDFVITDIAWIV